MIIQNIVYGLFGYTDGANIKNIVIMNSSITNSSIAGAIVGVADNSTTILNCSNYANIKSTYCVGGICGAIGLKDKNVRDVLISNCKNYGKIEESMKMLELIGGIGGIAGYAEGKIQSCKNYGIIDILHTNGYNERFGIGGIVGRGESIEITQCSNLNDVTTVGGVAGGIMAYSNQNIGGMSKISQCFNLGTITSNSDNNGYSGGIVSVALNIEIADCYNKGTIKGNWAGGITTWISASSIIKNCCEIGNSIQSNKGSHLIIDNYIDGVILLNNYVTGNLVNAVGFDGNNVSVASTQVQSKDISDFKKTVSDTSSVAYLLNGKKVSGVWSQGSDRGKLINDGYPYLTNNYILEE